MDHRQRHAEACRKAFEGFVPDLSSCRRPDQVLRILKLAASGAYSAEIAAELGTTPKQVQKVFRRYNFPALHNLCPPVLHERQGWKGGKSIVKGYEYQRVPDHPHASKHGKRVATHRLVMEQTLGRYLLPTEVVDHIDGNRLNNAPDNLRVFPSNAEHLRATLKGRCPQWTEDGKRRISEAVSLRHQLRRAAQAAATPSASENDAGP